MRPLILAGLGPVGSLLPLGEVQHHALHVLRLRDGDRVKVSDGAGRQGEGQMEGAGVRLLTLETVVAWAAELVVGLPRTALLEELVTLTTEAGVAVLHLVPVQRTPPGRVREDRLLRLINAAATQCGRATLPEVVLHQALGACLPALGPGRRVLGRPGATPLRGEPGPLVGAIGPEGGFDEEEENRLLDAGFEAVGLGPHTLRAPSAALALLARAWGG